MEDFFKAVVEFILESIGYAVVATLQDAVNQSPPRQAAGILLGTVSLLIAFALFVIEWISADSQRGGPSQSSLLVGGAVAAVLAGASAYCFVTSRTKPSRR